MNNKKFKVGIVGGTSLLAGILIKYLNKHPYVDLDYIDSDTHKNEKLSKFHRITQLGLQNDVIFKEYSPDYIKKNLDIVFIAKPHKIAMKYVKDLYDENSNLKIIDLSGDFRIKNVNEYEKWYNTTHIAKYLIEKSIYGLTEIYRQSIKNAKLIANPGCYPTNILLALYPLIKEKTIEPSNIIINSYSGVSGAGRNPVVGKNLFIDAFNNIIPYKILQHQHIPEIEEQLSIDEKIKITFVPHITSIEDGILSTIYVKPKKNDAKFFIDLFKNFYNGSVFVKITENKIPEVKDVIGTNKCVIGTFLNTRTNILIIISVIDNIIKGGAGQAIQNMNVMLGLKENTALN